MRRLIFTLLYDGGYFMLSRNFRLQRVGTLDWLLRNYDFSTVSRGLDELMILDVSRGGRDPERFAETARKISSRCFIPLTLGGGVSSTDIARLYLRSGADKILVNTAFHTAPQLAAQLAAHYGRQCIVAGVDYRATPNGCTVVTGQGTVPVDASLTDWLRHVQAHGAGEILLQSMDQDGTGMGLNLPSTSEVAQSLDVPCIVMGGVGKAEHIIRGLQQPFVDAVATANLFNFVGSAFLQVRQALLTSGVTVARWDGGAFASLKGRFAAIRPEGQAGAVQ